MKILIVEDEPTNQQVAQLALNNMGYEVDVASTGHKALQLYQANHYAAILMDLDLPDMQGTEVTREIRADEKKVVTMYLLLLLLFIVLYWLKISA